MAKNIMIVEPPFYRLYEGSYSLRKYPLALGYLSAVVLRDTDWNVQAYNADFDADGRFPFEASFLSGQGYRNYLRNLQQPVGKIWQEVEESIREFAPDVIGISTKTQNFASAKIVAAIAKAIDPEIKILIGGPHPSMSGEEAFECEDIDLAIVHEGEETLVDLLHALDEGRDLAKVPGLIFRQDDKVVRNVDRPYIKDLDTLPFPHTSAPKALKDYDQYPLEAFWNIFSMRGCPYKCEFCGSREIWSRKVRFRSARNVVDEIKALGDLGLHQVVFDDDTWGIKPTFIRELGTLMKEECPKLRWSCEIVVGLLNDEVCKLMKESGCFSVQIGVESGSNEMLRKVVKATTVEQSLAAAKLLRKYGLRVETFFMVGFPYETEKSLKETWDTIKKIASDLVILSVFTPYPGTDAFEVCRANGMVDDSYDVSLYNHTSPSNCFTPHIEPERFRKIVNQIEKTVEWKNWRSRGRNLISFIRVNGPVIAARKIAKYGRDVLYSRMLRVAVVFKKKSATA